MTLVWFIRHGESRSNAGLPTCNTVVTPLTARGWAQAEQVARAIERTPDLIVTSPYLRTKQTAEPLVARFRAARQEEWPVHEFTYLALPRDRAMTSHERQPLRDAFWERCDPQYVDGEGVESFVAMMARVDAAVQQLRHMQEQFVVVFSHGHFMKGLLWSLVQDPGELSAERMRRFRAFYRGVRTPNTVILKLLATSDGSVWNNGLHTMHLVEEQKYKR